MTVFGYLAPAQNRDSKTYHTDPHCHSFPENPSEHSVEYLERHGFEECKICAGEVQTSTGGSREIFNAALKAGEAIADGGER